MDPCTFNVNVTVVPASKLLAILWIVFAATAKDCAAHVKHQAGRNDRRHFNLRVYRQPEAIFLEGEFWQ